MAHRERRLPHEAVTDTFAALAVGAALSGLAAARRHHGLPPLSPPHWLVWLPIAPALAMAAASLPTRQQHTGSAR